MSKDAGKDGVHSERNTAGKFVKGNKAAVGNSGRPPETNRKEYVDKTFSSVTLEDWGKVMAIALKDALDEKDAWARKNAREFLAKYILPQKIEMDFKGDIPVKIVAVQGFKGWGKNGDSEA